SSESAHGQGYQDGCCGWGSHWPIRMFSVVMRTARGAELTCSGVKAAPDSAVTSARSLNRLASRSGVGQNCVTVERKWVGEKQKFWVRSASRRRPIRIWAVEIRWYGAPTSVFFRSLSGTLLSAADASM